MICTCVDPSELANIHVKVIIVSQINRYDDNKVQNSPKGENQAMISTTKK